MGSLFRNLRAILSSLILDVLMPDEALVKVKTKIYEVMS